MLDVGKKFYFKFYFTSRNKVYGVYSVKPFGFTNNNVFRKYEVTIQFTGCDLNNSLNLGFRFS